MTKRVLVQLTEPPKDHTGLEDIQHTIRTKARTIITDETELKVQQWLVNSFTDDRFESRRHECANAAMVLFPELTHGRSRELYDLTMLEVRRVLYDERHQTVPPGRLYGTRQAWMTRYAPLMNADELTKFAVLMRDLAPYLVLLVDAQNRNHRLDRSPTVGRKNVELILYGDPDAVPLFPE